MMIAFQCVKHIHNNCIFHRDIKVVTYSVWLEMKAEFQRIPTVGKLKRWEGRCWLCSFTLACLSVCAGIRSVSFYEHIVTVGTGQGSLLFYDIRAQRFLENPFNPNGGYRKCPGDGILKLTTGKGWLVCSFVFLFFPNQAVNCGQSNCSWCTCAMSLPTYPLIFLSESRWDVEELLLRHSFLPQCSVHPLLWRLWHQAVCSRWTALFWPARQLRRIVELASSSPPSLCHYIFVQTFYSSSPSIPLQLPTFSVFGVPFVTLFCSHLDSGAWYFLHFITAFSIIVVYICPPFHRSFSLNNSFALQLLFFLFVICYSFGFFLI